MPNQTIRIKGVNNNGELKLSDHGKTEVNSKWINRKITWKIKKQAVKSFLLVGKTSINPFETPIPTTFATRVELVVDEDYPETDWEYSIHWKDEHETVHIYDPLIYIKPGTTLSDYFIPLVIVSALSLIGIALFSTNKKRNR